VSPLPAGKEKGKRRKEKGRQEITVSLLPLSFSLFPSPQAVSFLLHCPARWRPAPGSTEPLPGVGVTHHRALWSPDFPPPRGRPSGRPTDPNLNHTRSAP